PTPDAHAHLQADRAEDAALQEAHARTGPLGHLRRRLRGEDVRQDHALARTQLEPDPPPGGSEAAQAPRGDLPPDRRDEDATAREDLAEGRAATAGGPEAAPPDHGHPDRSRDGLEHREEQRPDPDPPEALERSAGRHASASLR